jgi:DNA-directed RNA polymerase specialized sigma24 family protein
MTSFEKIQKLARIYSQSVSSQLHVRDACLLHVQDHLVSVYLKDPQMFDAYPTAYLNKIARNSIKDFFQTVLPKANILSAFSKEVPIHVYSSVDRRMDIETYFSLLPKDHQFIVRSLYEGYTVQEIANQTGVQLSSLKSFILRHKKFWQEVYHSFEDDCI